MARLFDCFLYNNECELLEIRIRLLSEVVDRFVIVWSSQTFTGRAKAEGFPWQRPIVERFRDRITLITVDNLPGSDAWRKEWYSRDRLADGLTGLAAEDIVLVSDIDEVPRPSVLGSLGSSSALNGPVVLGLDYFNFKFNYQLVHGPQAVWPGPVACRFSDFTSPQKLRDIRWEYVTGNPGRFLLHAGWHFSFLAANNEVREKLASFAHQEPAIQSRTEAVEKLIAARQGFHDHLHPCAVWAVVALDSFGCSELSTLVAAYPSLLLAEVPDDKSEVRDNILLSTIRMLKGPERVKVMSWCTPREIGGEAVRRVRARVARALKGSAA